MERYTETERISWLKRCVDRPPGTNIPTWCAEDGRPSSGSLYKWSWELFGKGLTYVSHEEAKEKAKGMTNGASPVADAARELVTRGSDGFLLEAIARRDQIILDLLAELDGLRSG